MIKFLIGFFLLLMIVVVASSLIDKAKNKNILDYLCEFTKYGNVTYTISENFVSDYSDCVCQVTVAYNDFQGNAVSVNEEYKMSAKSLASILADKLESDSYVLSGESRKYKVYRDVSMDDINLDILDSQVSHYVNELLKAKEKVRNNAHNTTGYDTGYVRLSSFDFKKFCILWSYDNFTSTYQKDGTITYEMSMSKTGMDFLNRFYKACSENKITVTPYFYLLDYNTKKYSYVPVEHHKATIQRPCVQHHSGFFGEGIEFRG